jgi:hypothetical protein
VVEKSPITCVLWPSVWCASPGTSPGTCVGFSCSSDGCAQPLTRTAPRISFLYRAPPAGRAGAAAPGWRRGWGGAGGGTRGRLPVSGFLSIVFSYDIDTRLESYVHGTVHGFEPVITRDLTRHGGTRMD